MINKVATQTEFIKKLFNEISVAGWKPVDNTENNQINEVEVRQLFELIDTEKTGVINLKVIKQYKNIFQINFLKQGFFNIIKCHPKLLRFNSFHLLFLYF